MAEVPDLKAHTAPPGDPLDLFDAWYQQAVECPDIKYAHAVCLSTIGLDDLSEARMVLLEIHDASGFVFFTDSESAKGRSLARRPGAALTFYWGPLDRQIRIRGRVELASDATSDECFSKRPRGAQITAWASHQSRELEEGELEKRVESFNERFADTDPIPRPPRWQAYRVVPHSIEFWSARANRLHDRLLYEHSQDEGWTTRRLEP